MPIWVYVALFSVLFLVGGWSFTRYMRAAINQQSDAIIASTKQNQALMRALVEVTTNVAVTVDSQRQFLERLDAHMEQDAKNFAALIDVTDNVYKALGDRIQPKSEGQQTEG